MSTLKEKAEQILQEKEEKIIPENFSNNLEIFGINGNITESYGYSTSADTIHIDNDFEQLTLLANMPVKYILNANSYIERR